MTETEIEAWARFNARLTKLDAERVAAEAHNADVRRERDRIRRARQDLDDFAEDYDERDAALRAETRALPAMVPVMSPGERASVQLVILAECATGAGIDLTGNLS